MRFSHLARLIPALAGLTAASDAWPQEPFDLDLSFRTQIEVQNVNSTLVREDGELIISGQIKFPGDSFVRFGALLNTDGSRDFSFPDAAYMGGKLTAWNDRIYAGNGPGVRRSWSDGTLDNSFVINPPYVSIFQGGDYHVFDDGRVALGGRHYLSDTVRDFVGPHCLTWFSNQGYLDTTRTHRTCSGVLITMKELPNGQFMGSGSTSTWDGQAASRIFRFNADGSLDPSFQANAIWGSAYSFLPMADGRVYAGGNFRIGGIPDTLNLVRFMPDGSLDPTFSNTAPYRLTNLLYPNNAPQGFVLGLEPLESGQLIVVGSFDRIDGNPRGGIALIDDSGTLLSDYFTGNGCGGYFYQPNTSQPPVSYSRLIAGIAPAPDGQYYIWGAYHGYNDGTTNDTLQRMVSRLHGFNVGISDEGVTRTAFFEVCPNPNTGRFTMAFADPLMAQSYYGVYDALGKLLYQRPLPSGSRVEELDLSRFGKGSYVLKLTSPDGVCHERVVVE